jgi:hypothetical protein
MFKSQQVEFADNRYRMGLTGILCCSVKEVFLMDSLDTVQKMV